MNLILIGAGSETVLSELLAAGVRYRVWLEDKDAELAGSVSVRISGSASPSMVAGVLVAWMRTLSSRSISVRIGGEVRSYKGNELTVKEGSRLLSQGEDIRVAQIPRKGAAPSLPKRLLDAPSKVLEKAQRRRAYRE